MDKKSFVSTIARGEDKAREYIKTIFKNIKLTLKFVRDNFEFNWICFYNGVKINIKMTKASAPNYDRGSAFFIFRKSFQ